jgi:CheY-like chemotaxis protein
MEQQLLQSEKLKSLGELAGGVAHNFNNVLAAILGRSQLLKRIVDSPPSKKERRKSVLGLKKGLEVIEKASLDGAETVRRIQEFARRRDDDKYFTLVDMTKVIDNVLEFTKLRWKNDAESKGIKIKIKKKLSILPSVPGSESELREVITNIINNAIDAMPHGGDITIKTFKKGTHACIKVKDTGMGVPQTMRDRIFDPFFTTKGPQSSGLGMSVSYGIIHRHRGTIMMDSVEGKGSTITIEVPFSEKTVEEIKVKSISSGQKKVNILIIEDEEDVRNLLKDILTHEGHRVETATNGKLGIEKFKKKDFDIVLTDLGMPGMSGWQVAEKIKSINGKVPISLVTGWSIDLKESEMKEKGIDFIIKKPYKLDQLVNVVQEGIILRDQLKAV